MSDSPTKKLTGALGDLLSLAKAISSALHDEAPERVDHILPEELRTTLAKSAADARAREKYGA